MPALAQDGAVPYAYVDIQRVLAESNLGRTAVAELTALQARRVQDLNERRLILLLDASTPGLLLADPALDVTIDVIDRLNGSTPARSTDS